MPLRTALTFSIVIAIVQSVLATLAILQHDAIFSELLRQRISVIAQTTALSFKPIVDLGLPISMIRNGNAIVARALEIDPNIRNVHAFNPSGIVVYSTASRPPTIAPEVLRAMQRSEGGAWGVETRDEIFSGYSILGREGGVVGAILVAYPKERLQSASWSILAGTVQTALMIWAVFSLASILLVRLLLAAPERAIARLESIADERASAEENAAPDHLPSGGFRSLFRHETETLRRNLAEAGLRFQEARRALSKATNGLDMPETAPAGCESQQPPSELEVTADPTRSLSRKIARRLAPLAALIIVMSALILGVTTLRSVNRSIEPELAARTNLIGTVVSENVQRAVAAGVPIDKLVGAEIYFGDMLARLPEVAYIAVATGRILLEAGIRVDPYLAPPRERKDVRSHPIFHEGEEIAYVIIDIEPGFISRRFMDVFLDMSVVVLVTVLVAFEVMVLLTSRSLTADLDRLNRLAAMQAVGDFSGRVGSASRGAIVRVTSVLVKRAEALNAQFSAALSTAGDQTSRRAALEEIASRYRLSTAGPMNLRISYFSDIRLALFLFAAADELPLAFLPLYTRDAANAWSWLDQSVLISLPLAGYLIAIFIASPYARALAERFGVRTLFLVAAIPTVVAHLGLYFAGSAQEIILWRTVTGVGYALVTLACQDYVLAAAPRGQRDSTLGMFTLVLFGGIFSGVALGGVLADRLGQQNVFLLSATLIAVSALLALRLIAPASARRQGEAPRVNLRDMLSTLQSGHFGALVFGIAIPANVLLQAFVSYLVALTLDSLGASTADIGRALMVYFLGIIVFGPLGGRIAEAGIRVSIIALSGAVLAGASLILPAAWPSQLAVLGAVLGAGVGHGLVRGAQVSLAMTIAETELARLGPTAVLGALRTFERVGSILGLLVIAALAGYAGYQAATAVVAAWSLLGAATFALLLLGTRALPASGSAEAESKRGAFAA